MAIPKISIICPVYKAEPYLEKCINSVIHQYFNEWELILVDDGSPDNSGYICDHFSYKDSRIKVHHKKNEGVSAARQDGLDIASGEYIIHLDPDDWIEPNMLSELYENAISNNLDMLICDFYEDRKDYSIVIQQQPSKLFHKDVFIDLLTRLHGSCCNKLIRKSLFDRFNIKFPIGYSYLEDLYVILKICKHPINIGYLSHAYYHYIQDNNPNSLVHKPTKGKAESIIKFCNEFEQDMINLNLNKVLYHYKFESKLFAMQSGQYKCKDLKHIFHEINNQIIQEAYIKWDKESWKVELALSMYMPNKIANLLSRILALVGRLIKR